MSLFQAQEVTVRFGGVTAVDDVTMEVGPGLVTGLIGPNGAGKTTFFNVITGLQEPTEGRVHFDDRDITGLKPHQRAQAGIARTFQRLEVFGSLSVWDNVRTAVEIRSGWSGEKVDAKAVTGEIIELVGLSELAHERADAIPTGHARLTELGRAIALRPKLLLLDEPSSGLNEEETSDLARLISQLADEGLAVLLVEHDMSLVMSVSRWLHVLNFGRLIASGPPVDVQADPEVQKAYLGEQGDDHAA